MTIGPSRPVTVASEVDMSRTLRGVERVVACVWGPGCGVGAVAGAAVSTSGGVVEGVEDVGEGRVVGGVFVDVGVPERGAGSDDERRAELGDALSGAVDVVAAGARPPRPRPGPAVGHQAEERDASNGRGAGGVGPGVDEDRGRDVLV